MQTLDIADERPRDVYGCDLLLLRPDMHVVWRGNDAPSEPQMLAALATGHSDCGETEGSRSSSSARSTRAFML